MQYSNTELCCCWLSYVASLYTVGYTPLVYLWCWMSCWTYGKNNNLCLLNKYFVDSSNRKISHKWKQWITGGWCKERLERMRVAGGRERRASCHSRARAAPHKQLWDLQGSAIKFISGESCNVRSQHEKSMAVRKTGDFLQSFICVCFPFSTHLSHNYRKLWFSVITVFII